MFAYCLNNPINRIDCDGGLSIRAIRIITSGLMDAVIALSTGGSLEDAILAFVLGAAGEFIFGLYDDINLLVAAGQAIIQVFEMRSKGASWAQSFGAGTAAFLGAVSFGTTHDDVLDLVVDATFGFGKSMVSEGIVVGIEQNIETVSVTAAPRPTGNDTKNEGIWGGGSGAFCVTMMDYGGVK